MFLLILCFYRGFMRGGSLILLGLILWVLCLNFQRFIELKGFWSWTIVGGGWGGCCWVKCWLGRRRRVVDGRREEWWKWGRLWCGNFRFGWIGWDYRKGIGKLIEGSFFGWSYVRIDVRGVRIGLWRKNERIHWQIYSFLIHRYKNFSRIFNP